MSRRQSPAEEKWNVVSHAVGFGVAFVAWVALVVQSAHKGSWMHFWAFTIFCAALMGLFLVSSLYHGAKPGPRKHRLHIWDHALIYVLIAGSYSPFCLLALEGPVAWIVLLSVWAFALFGILFKIRWTGRFGVLSTALYLLMGWAVLFVIKPLSASLPAWGLAWLVCGGVMYTVGVGFYVAERMRFHHAVWHVFVLAGGISHLIAASSVA
jgi:hemolysin III